MAGELDPEKAQWPPVFDRPSRHIAESAGKSESNNSETLPMRGEDSDHSGLASSIDTIEPVPVEDLRNAFRSRSQASSTRSRPLSIIPRSRRRGILARFAIIPEVERPYDYATGTKWLITFIVAIASAAAPIGSVIFFPALPQLSADFQITPTVANLSVALYMLSMSIFPLWWSSFSETLGRRTVYLTSFTLFTVFGVLSAISTSVAMLVVMRILSGGAAASVQAVGAGSIADIWEPKERGRAMGMFYLGPLMGPLLAPIFGGALAQSFGWRSTQWFLVIYGAVLVLVLTFCLPETLRATKSPTTGAILPAHTDGNGAALSQLSRVSTSRSAQQKAKSVVLVLKRWFIEPLYILAYLRFAPVALTVYYASITFGSLYLLNISIQQNFSQPPYSFPIMTIGLLYIPNSVGYILASIFGGRWIDIIMHREARAANRYDDRGKLILLPEDRMRENAYVAAVLYPSALIWYGWAIEYQLHWSIPAVANFFFGVGTMLIFSMATTMLTEFMPRKSSSGVALNNFVRNIFSCVGGIVASPLIDAIGNGWLFTGLGLIALFSGTVVWVMRRWGPRWREEMDKAMND